MAEALDLDVTADDPSQGPVSLPEVLVHMVEEYARPGPPTYCASGSTGGWGQ